MVRVPHSFSICLLLEYVERVTQIFKIVKKDLHNDFDNVSNHNFDARIRMWKVSKNLVPVKPVGSEEQETEETCGRQTPVFFVFILLFDTSTACFNYTESAVVNRYCTSKNKLSLSGARMERSLYSFEWTAFILRQKSCDFSFTSVYCQLF